MLASIKRRLNFAFATRVVAAALAGHTVGLASGINGRSRKKTRVVGALLVGHIRLNDGRQHSRVLETRLHAQHLFPVLVQMREGLHHGDHIGFGG